jgi:hypothetical protein
MMMMKLLLTYVVVLGVILALATEAKESGGGVRKLGECDVSIKPKPTCASRRSLKRGKKQKKGKKNKRSVRFATFNLSLNRGNLGDLAAELALPGSDQPDTVAEIIQRVRPDVLLLNEFDYDSAGAGIAGFKANYLEVPHGDAEPIVYPYSYAAPSNTGIPSGFDYNNNGVVSGGDDAYGFGFFPGQYAMAVLSMYPIDMDSIRTFQTFKWKDMPCNFLPTDPATGEPWYTPGPELDSFRLSSKNHIDVPIKIGRKTIHLLGSHPTPPVFDGPEDRNGRRNHDEIRFWADYISKNPHDSEYIYDDQHETGGIRGKYFVIAGDMNADPFDGDSFNQAAELLLKHPLINTDMPPSSVGGSEQSALQGQRNIGQCGNPAFDTADFADFAPNPGNLRADYVLPSEKLDIVDSGVFWPQKDDPLFPLAGTFPFPSSDHRLVWVDVVV